MKDKFIQNSLQGVFREIPPIFSFVILLLFLFGCNSKNTHKARARFVKSHLIESDSLFLSGQLSDFIKTNTGYALIERDRSTVLVLDESLMPIARLGNKGNGPNELNVIGSTQFINNQFFISDIGHRRIATLDKQGQFIRAINSDYLANPFFNFVISDSQLVFSIPRVDSSIVVIDMANEKTHLEIHTVKDIKSEHQRYKGNQAYIKRWNNQYIHFPPTEMTVTVLSDDFIVLDELDLSNLDLWKVTKQRMKEIYGGAANRTIQLYTDVYQDRNKFYLLAYSDYVSEESNYEYKRNLNQVIQLNYDSAKNKIEIEDVIHLSDSGYYKQLLVEGDKILVFDLQKFVIDEYSF